MRTNGSGGFKFVKKKKVPMIRKDNFHGAYVNQGDSNVFK